MVSGVRISDGSPKEYYPNFSFRTVSSGIQENTDRDKSLSVFLLPQIFRRCIPYKVLAAVVDNDTVPSIPVRLANRFLHDLYGSSSRYVEKSLAVLRLRLASQRKSVSNRRRFCLLFISI